MDSFMFLCLPDSIAFDLNSIQAHSVSYFLSALNICFTAHLLKISLAKTPKLQRETL